MLLTQIEYLILDVIVMSLLVGSLNVKWGVNGRRVFYSTPSCHTRALATMTICISLIETIGAT